MEITTRPHKRTAAKLQGVRAIQMRVHELGGTIIKNKRSTLYDVWTDRHGTSPEPNFGPFTRQQLVEWADWWIKD